MVTNDSVEPNEVTLALAKKECAEHLEGMEEVCNVMRKRPLRIKAYRLTDDIETATGHTNYKIIHFVRHGQGFHNLMADMAKKNGVEWTNFIPSSDNPYSMTELLDCPLTNLGRQQALLLQNNQVQQQMIYDTTIKPELIIVSPCCRTLQTATIVFEPLLQLSSSDRIPCLAHEMVREETGIHICDQRRPVSRIKYEFPQVDFSLLTSDDDPLYQNDRRETKLEVAERIYKFMEWLYERPETKLGIVSHSGWLLTAFNAIFECSHPDLQQWFQTGEMRSVKLEFISNTATTSE